MAELKDANTNPWYVLMTLYGEQTGEEIDWELHAQNRAAWNAWSRQGTDPCFALKSENELKEFGPEPRGWSSFESEIKQLHQVEMKRRNLEGFDYPGFPKACDIIDLSWLEIRGFLCLSSLVFSGQASLCFLRCFGVYAIAAEFESSVDFRNVYVSGDLNVSCATFGEKVSFIDSFIKGSLLADMTKFLLPSKPEGKREGEILFWDVSPAFNRACVKGETFFRSAEFSGVAIFVDVHFEDKAEFNAAIFRNDVDFRRSEFDGLISFHGVKFEGKSDFSEAYFKGRTLFSGAIFKNNIASFRSTQFFMPTSFNKTKFLKGYPALTGAILHDTTTFTPDDECWPVNCKSNAILSRESCAKIRHAVGQQGLPEDEHFFFRREMTYAGQVGTWLDRLPYRVFGSVSDYGHSILRPAVGLGLLWIVPALIYTIAFEWMLIMDSKRVIAIDGFGLSFANIFKFFGFQRTYYDIDDIQALHGLLQVMGAAQTVFGFILLFFLGLGLRTRFRMR